jgi:SH3 domain-containing protein
MRVLLTLGLIGAIVYSVVVDQPQVSALPQGLGDIWDLLESSGQLVETVPTNRADLNAPDLLQVNSAANIRSGPFPSAEIVGIAPAGASVQAAARYVEWVLIVDPWSWETGWIHSQRLAPYPTPATLIVAGQCQGERRLVTRYCAL